MTTVASPPDVLVEQRGRAICLTLNRPKALNALTLSMVRSLRTAFEATCADPETTCILLTGAGGKAFCAGGDVRAVWQAAREAGDDASGMLQDAFFREEYALNALIAGCPKPQVSVWDGITMGGGNGVSMHGQFRVASERAMFAMPETSIGLLPDVGGTFSLAAAPGEIGTYLGLTGARIGAADLLYSGLATHFIPSARLCELDAAMQACGSTSELEETLGAMCSPAAAGPPPLLAHRDAIDRCFNASTVEEIEAALSSEGSSWADETLMKLRRMSPTSLKVTLLLLRQAKGKSLGACLQAEFRAVQRFVSPPSDFFEGIRAALVDKDRQPQWEPATLAAVNSKMLAEYLEPLGNRELVLPSIVGFRSVL